MKNLFQLLCFLTFIITLACNNNKNPAPTASTKSTRVVNQDSLRLAYTALIKQKPKLLPPRQVIVPGKLYPVDEGQTDTAFYVFRAELLKILEAKDEFKLLEMVGDSIQNGFGGAEFGISGFVEKWKLDVNKDSSGVWQILQNIITQGGVFDKTHDNFVAPYYTATFPDTYDANTVGILTGEGVRVRAGANVNSQVLKTISYDILPVLNWQEKEDIIDGEKDYWVKIKYADNKEGFVFGKFIGSPYDYRATFTKQPNGSWLLTALVSGD
jgi:hypothetical protein